MTCVSCDKSTCVYHLWFCLCFFPGVFVGFRVTGACPVTTDLIMRVNVRTTTTTPVVDQTADAMILPAVALRWFFGHT